MTNVNKVKSYYFILNIIILGVFILILAYNLANILNIFIPKVRERNTDYNLPADLAEDTQITQLNTHITTLQEISRYTQVNAEV